MRPSLVLKASHARTPLIKFLGKRTTPSKLVMLSFSLQAAAANALTESVDHTPQPHPASPTHQLPESFANYRQQAQQHGPLGGQQHNGKSKASQMSVNQALKATAVGGPMTYGAIGGTPGRKLGPIEAKEGEFFDRSELPRRFQRRPWTDEEMDAITSGGASLW